MKTNKSKPILPILSKLARIIKSSQNEIVLAVAVVLISIISFQIGRIHSSRPPDLPDLKIGPAEQASLFLPSPSFSIIPSPITTEAGESSQKINFQVVASKNSNKYHFLWCSGAALIKEANRIYFASEQEAQARGYVLAGNCKK